MRSMLRRVVDKMSAHLSDDVLCQRVSDELDKTQAARGTKHLGKCWPCRSRREQLEGAALGIVQYSKHLIAPHLPQSPRWRKLFLAQLDQVASNVRRTSTWSRLISKSRA